MLTELLAVCEYKLDLKNANKKSTPVKLFQDYCKDCKVQAVLPSSPSDPFEYKT